MKTTTTERLCRQFVVYKIKTNGRKLYCEFCVLYCIARGKLLKMFLNNILLSILSK